jgi:hypothetical protein
MMKPLQLMIRGPKLTLLLLLMLLCLLNVGAEELVGLEVRLPTVVVEEEVAHIWVGGSNFRNLVRPRP